jgi:mRNA interferase RelE/StbE
VSWGYQFDARALKELRKLGKPDQERILRYLCSEVLRDPRSFGKPLRYDLAGLWCYRVGPIRIICQIKDRELLVLVVKVGNRRDVYD